MPRNLALTLALATLSATAASAQSAGPAAPADTTYMQAQAAPIEHNFAGEQGPGYQGPGSQGSGYQASDMRTRPVPPRDTGVTSSEPMPGVWLRVGASSTVSTVSGQADSTELRVEHGRANVTVNHPENNAQILVDLPGGQVSLLKDGLYTFNADTNTVRVLHGEADAFPGATKEGKGIKVKEDHQLAFGAASLRAVDVDPAQARADLLPGGGMGDHGPRGNGDGGGYPGYGFGGPNGDGVAYGYAPYPYPYYAYGYGYPYGLGYGYPFGVGLGFGYYGGFGGYYGGGFRGGFGGFRGGGGFRR